jgi:pSer/pThr/pTyr-binding forkhead associated (FHA) protein
MEDRTRVTTTGSSSGATDRQTLRVRLVFEVRAGTPVKNEAINLLFGNQMLVGREPTCDIPIIDNRVSRKHALLRIDPDAIRLTDLGSTNGTIRNGEPVTEEIIVMDRDRIDFGRARTFETKMIERDGHLASIRLAWGTDAYLLAPAEVLIGRADPANRACDLLIYDPALELRHARLEHFYGNTFVVSLNEQNPVKVNGKPVKELEIHSGQLLELGKTLVRYEVVGASS